ncbi:diguanylate cyclase [bacterium 3DAC]|nr:diguanylate cyclase [Dictyoglomota bacterium]UZN22472.1 diguanylate cyclase [bacterium 3DAC]
MAKSSLGKTLISTVAMFVIVSFIVVAIHYSRTSSEMTKILKKRIAYTQEITSSMKKLYASMDNKWKKERINFTRLQTIIIADSINLAYQTTGSVGFAKEVANVLVKMTYSFSKNTYSYVLDIKTGLTIAHPIDTSTSPPQYITEKITGACPEGLISYKWYKPGQEIQTEKFSYIKCIPSLHWAVGTSLYLEDIENSLSAVKQYIADTIDTLAHPLEGYIDFHIYNKLPKELSDIQPTGTVIKRSRAYIGIIHSNLTGLYYVYSISELTIIQKTLWSALPFLLIMLFLLVVLYYNIKTTMEKEKLLEDIWDELAGIEHAGTVSKEKLLSMIKKRIEEIETALTIKEFVGELSSLIAAAGTLTEALEYMYHYLMDPFKLKGLYLYIEKQGRNVPVTHMGQNTGIALTIPLNINGRKYNLTIYTEEPLSSSEIEILGEIIRSFIAKLEDIDESLTDPLTGAYTRRYLEDYASELISKEGSAAVLMLDLDHFKDVNDTLGHEEGDRVLKEVVSRIESTIRPSDVVIRMGGDEFVIIMKDLNYNAMCHAAERIKEHIKEPPITKGIPVSASIGAVYKEAGKDIDIETLIKLADKAMYKAKEKRDSVVCVQVD